MSDSQNAVRHQPRILAVTGGKGGVGKTSVALNMALILSRQGHRVLLLDGDTDLANVTIMLGQYPSRTLEQVLNNECTLEEAIFRAPWGLDVLPGASGVERCMSIAPSDRLSLMRRLAGLEQQYDYILIDTAAGLRAGVLHMIASAALACVVVTPDPTSLTDAFSLLKVLKRRGYKRTPSILINMARGPKHAQSIFQRFYAALQRHLDMTPHYLGAVWQDESVRRAVSRQQPVVLMPDAEPACRQFRVLVDMLKVRFDQLEPRRSGFAAYWNRVAEKQSGRSRPVEKPTAPVSADDRWRQWSIELEALLADPATTELQRYEALVSCLEQLGRHMDGETIEAIQTGLAAMSWEQLSPALRTHLASHLRQLADQVDPPPAAPEPASTDTTGQPQPRYDEQRFGQQQALIQALREKPADVSLDRLLAMLTDAS
ncbi:MinD-like ATPase involved in chromosome partitioning or flagellar assembly [Tamilnaduibacter salinus]|uniref:MinD-like ATPase involved in chromosome partitioning or flagellar assembly n=1 Tax=Tamilnaduibacter salinus TaxID=1484056 RepID=A0A2U1D0V0_9GAMM|nr:AAA family ATPase [Tamilnaduibacter salinus]PVY79007.1 MinD-like ATPase involved in chromosome partitioning or flagellar assembly [Tamilnaduibacter salinus]